MTLLEVIMLKESTPMCLLCYNFGAILLNIRLPYLDLNRNVPGKMCVILLLKR